MSEDVKPLETYFEVSWYTDGTGGPIRRTFRPEFEADARALYAAREADSWTPLATLKRVEVLAEEGRP